MAPVGQGRDPFPANFNSPGTHRPRLCRTCVRSCRPKQVRLAGNGFRPCPTGAPPQIGVKCALAALEAAASFPPETPCSKPSRAISAPSPLPSTSARCASWRSPRRSSPSARTWPEPPQLSTDRGAMVTVIDKGGLGYAATSDLTPAGLREAAGRARRGWRSSPPGARSSTTAGRDAAARRDATQSPRGRRPGAAHAAREDRAARRRIAGSAASTIASSTGRRACGPRARGRPTSRPTAARSSRSSTTSCPTCRPRRTPTATRRRARTPAAATATAGRAGWRSSMPSA